MPWINPFLQEPQDDWVNPFLAAQQDDVEWVNPFMLTPEEEERDPWWKRAARYVADVVPDMALTAVTFGQAPTKGVREFRERAALGAAQGVLTTAAGTAELTGKALGLTSPEAGRALEYLGGAIGSVRTEHIDPYLQENEPETEWGKYGQPLGRIAAEAGMFMIPDAVVGKAAELVQATKYPLLAGLLTKLAKPASKVGQVVREALFGAPIDAAIAVGRPEESLTAMVNSMFPGKPLDDVLENPFALGAIEAALGALAAGGVILALPGKPTFRRAGTSEADQARIRNQLEVGEGTVQESIDRFNRNIQGYFDTSAESSLRQLPRPKGEDLVEESVGKFYDNLEKYYQSSAEGSKRQLPTAVSAPELPREYDQIQEALKSPSVTGVQREQLEERSRQILDQLDRSADLSRQMKPSAVEPPRPSTQPWGEIGTRLGERGVTNPRLGTSLAGAAVGGTVGGIADEEHPLRGAAIGAGIGLASGLGLPSMPASVKRQLDTAFPKTGTDRIFGKTIDELRIRDIPPKLGRQDFDHHMNQIYQDPAGVRETADRVSRLKRQGLANQRVTFEDDIYPEGMDLASRTRAAGADALPVDHILKDPKNRPLQGPAEAVALSQMYRENGLWLLDAEDKLRRLTEAPGASEGVGLLERQKLEGDIRSMELRQDHLIRRYITGASEGARTQVTLRLLANKTLDPAVWRMKLQRALGGEPITTEMVSQIDRLSRDGDRKGLVDLVSKHSGRVLHPWKNFAEYWWTLVRSGMLSLPVSLGRGTVGNAVKASYDVLAKPATVSIGDILAGAITGRHHSTAIGGFGGTWARIKGFAKGIKQMGAAVRGEMLDDVLDKYDIRGRTELGPVFDTSGWFSGSNAWWAKALRANWNDKAMKTIFGLQGAVDRPWRIAAREGSKYEQAQVLAYFRNLEMQADELAKAGLPGEVTREQYMQALVSNPTPEMALRARVESLEAVFQNETVISNVARSVLSGTKGPVRAGTVTRQTGEAFGHVIQGTTLPFIKTPSAVIQSGVEATPIGMLFTMRDAMELYRYTRSAKTVPQNIAEAGEDAIKAWLKEQDASILSLQRMMAKRIGRWTTGLAAIGIGYKLFQEGLMTGALPEAQGARQQMSQRGAGPYSVFIPEEIPLVGPVLDVLGLSGRYHPVGQLQPVGALLAFGAALAEGDAEDGNYTSALHAMGEPVPLAKAAGGVARSALDLPFLRGVKDVVDALSQPERKVPTLFESKAGGLVPNLVAGAARGLDPVIRDVQGPIDALMNRIPGLSQKLPAKPGLFGDQIIREKGTRDRVMASFFNITGGRRATEEDDPILAEIVNVGYVVPALTRKTKQGEGLEAYRRRKMVYGQFTRAAIEETISSEDYLYQLEYAREIIRTDPRFYGTSPYDLANFLRKEILSSAVSRARSELTEYLREQGYPF